MWENRRFSIIVVAVYMGFVNVVPGDSAQSPIEFEGRLEFCKNIPVGITAGTAEYQDLVQIESVCFDKRYANAWGATVHIGWLPVKETTWRITIELLDSDGNVLRHSRDEPTIFTCKAGLPSQTDMQHVDLDLGSMHDQGRRHAARFRVLLMKSEKRVTGENTHTLEVEVLDQESREPIGNTTVVVSSSYLKDTFWRRSKTLCVTDPQVLYPGL